MTLFDPGAPAPPPEKLSADRRRTIRNRQLIDGGTHPVTRLRLADNGETCGTCEHSGTQGGVAGTYWKCGAQNGRYITGGPATDIRLSWPACVLWGPPELDGFT
jgi:hypothetical protein